MSEPEVPVKVTVALEAPAESAAVNVTVRGVPGTTVKADGETVTLAGNPLSWMLMLVSKPLEPVAESEIDADPPD